jgi:DNA-binding MarR family transcriptional regulator
MIWSPFMLTKQEYGALSNFRFQLSRFIRFSEGAARAAGITPKQYLLLLHICGTPDRDWASVGELAERLQASAHGTVGLVNRCNAAHLVTKRRNAEDARLVEVHATPLGRKLVQRIATRHRTELQSLRKVFRVSHVS